MDINDLFGPIAANDNDRPVRRDRAAEHAKRLSRAPERICDFCGCSFRKVQKDKKPPRFCSKACSGKAGMSAIHAALPIVPPKPVLHSVYRPLCRCCGVRFTAKTKASRLCSDECKVADARIQALNHSVANDNRDRSPRPCPECGVSFVPEYGNKRRIFCSAACGKRSSHRAGKQARRAKLKGATVEAVHATKVFERDGWRCQLCRIKTPRKMRGTMKPNAPELDHIMPLALGGDHSYANTHCACRSCNSAKGAMPKGQMRLFG